MLLWLRAPGARWASTLVSARGGRVRARKWRRAEELPQVSGWPRLRRPGECGGRRVAAGAGANGDGAAGEQHERQQRCRELEPGNESRVDVHGRNVRAGRERRAALPARRGACTQSSGDAVATFAWAAPAVRSARAIQELMAATMRMTSRLRRTGRTSRRQGGEDTRLREVTPWQRPCPGRWAARRVESRKSRETPSETRRQAVPRDRYVGLVWREVNATWMHTW